MRLPAQLFALLLCLFLGGFGAIAVGGIGICGRAFDFGSMMVACLCALGAGACSALLSWGAPAAFGAPFAALCLVLRAAVNDRPYFAIIAGTMTVALLVTLFVRKVVLSSPEPPPPPAPSSSSAT